MSKITSLYDHPNKRVSLKEGDGGDTFDTIEARVSAVDASVKRADEKLGKIEVDLVRLDRKIITLLRTLRLRGELPS
ncbi:hypothetical protein [Ochrobactrum sp. Marseille-Q0166]|uniref:hypothetical protein n=1 Tax=Ochrobactrum sp. Marseille-Q0166 TaxID=2761105 RepID=UPI001655AC14|nr:hypothetical protein [Ochrobactrum sp. Marseille-Q0166]MBC8719037.1 hypothetical protein [Ochrobactrum sp. Marseille-Q0166]